MRNDALALAAIAAAALAVSGAVRRLVWAALRGAVGALIAVVAAVVERRRGLERPARQLPPGRTWWCAVYLEHSGRLRTLASGAVTGPWVTAGDVEREAMARWVEVHGWPTVGRLCARAQPRGVRASRAA